MLRRIQIQPVEAPMTDSEAAVLLAGWIAEPPSRPAHGFGETGLWLWTSNLGDVWIEHERFLRTLAARWGWLPAHYVAPRNEHGLRLLRDAPGDGHEVPYFYGEALTRSDDGQDEQLRRARWPR